MKKISKFMLLLSSMLVLIFVLQGCGSISSYGGYSGSSSSSTRTCSTCGGKGYTETIIPGNAETGSMPKVIKKTCSTCFGKGRY